jgi:1-acyl-sn-glycerol-3-phosphate acyltransferase
LGIRGLFGFRAYRAERIPAHGPVVLLANHESHFDPVLIGVSSRRRLSFLARKTLFNGPFGLLIRSLNAIPVDRDGVGISGLREIIRRLKEGEATLVFPEGTRSPDGRLGELQPGFCILVRRAGATIVPVGIGGAFEVWPRNRSVPRFGRIAVHVGRPISPGEIEALTDAELVALVRRRISASVRVAEWRIYRSRRAPVAHTHAPAVAADPNRDARERTDEELNPAN